MGSKMWKSNKPGGRIKGGIKFSDISTDIGQLTSKRIIYYRWSKQRMVAYNIFATCSQVSASNFWKI